MQTQHSNITCGATTKNTGQSHVPTFTDLTPQHVLPTTTNFFFFFNRSPYRLTRQRKSKKAMEMADQQKLPR